MKNVVPDSGGIMNLPLLALRGLIAMPGMHLDFEVGRKQSIAAVDEAVKHDRLLFIVAQRDLRVDHPAVEDLYAYGITASVRQVLKMPDGTLRVLVQGVSRAQLIEVTQTEPYYSAVIETQQTPPAPTDSAKSEALVRMLREVFEDYAEYNPKMPQEIMMNVLAVDEPGQLADYIASNIPLKLENKQKILETLDPIKRLETLIVILHREIEILDIDRKIGRKVREQIEKNQREYYLSEQIKALQSELGEGKSTAVEAQEYADRIRKLGLAPEQADKLLKEAARLGRLHSNSPESAVVRTYLDTCLEIPWNVYTKDRHDLKASERILEADHYGLEKVKERILEFLAVRMIAPDFKGQILCLVGPPGVGKTSIAQSVARAMRKKFVRLSLGGVRDEAEIRGHRKTYIGAMPGRIISALQRAGSLNPVLLLDEIDKLGDDYRGDPAAALLEVLDPEQNKAFYDHYVEIPVDLSQVLFITTANSADDIPRPLLDRMDVIEIGSYTQEEKKQIALRHLFPKQLARHGLNRRKLVLTEDAVGRLIESYTREAGVRNLERRIAELCRKAARGIVGGQVKRLQITPDKLEDLLGPARYHKDALPDEDQVGIATGLAYTATGGEILFVEAGSMEGSGHLELTGSLGDVMKESARAALSYIRSRVYDLGIEPDFYKTKDIHIHVPEGAIPKDGPSAGVTITTALVSELTRCPVRRNVAMTGEITLRGRVLPVGGLREKAMAAYKAGITTVLIPRDNAAELSEIDEAVRKALTFVPVKDMDEVLTLALCPRGDALRQRQSDAVSALPALCPEPAGERKSPFLAQ